MTSGLTHVPAVQASRYTTAAAMSSSNDPALATVTWVRLRGLPSSTPIVPLRSSPAMNADPMAIAMPARMIAPYVE